MNIIRRLLRRFRKPKAEYTARIHACDWRATIYPKPRESRASVAHSIRAARATLGMIREYRRAIDYERAEWIREAHELGKATIGISTMLH